MKFVAVTSCPTGIAHSQMGAEGLEQAAEELGHDIRVEIQGAMGAEDELTSDEIAEADAVIIAADTSVSRDRFEDKPVVKSPVAKAINEGKELIEEAIEKAEGADDSGVSPSEPEPTDSESDETAETPAESPTETEPSVDREDESSGIIGKLKQLFS
ncbi:MAG: PTS fructose transporter subunit IIB [Halapricum sp.]